MKINIKDEEKLKKLAEEFHESEDDIVNYMLDSFNENQFKEIARKSSLKTALYRHSHNLMTIRGLEYEIYAILGEYDYHIEDSGFDFKNKTFWFLMDVSEDEKKIDLDQVHFQINEGSSVQISVKKFINKISNWDKLDDAIDVAKEGLTNHFLDCDHVLLEFDERLDDEDDYIGMEINIGDFQIEYIPKLDECDKVMTEIEHKFRKALEI